MGTLFINDSTGGPGSGKQTQVQQLIKRYDGWVHLSMGDLLRDQISNIGSSESKWTMITDLMSNGELAPEVMYSKNCCIATTKPKW